MSRPCLFLQSAIYTPLKLALCSEPSLLVSNRVASSLGAQEVKRNGMPVDVFSTIIYLTLQDFGWMPSGLGGLVLL